MRDFLAACAAVLVLASTGFASAQDGAGEAESDAEQAERDERARILFQAGRVHFEAGEYERALPEFEEAYELSGRVALLYNIGVTRERLGQLEGALEALEAFLASDAEVPGLDREQLRRRTEALRERIARRGTGGESGSLPVGPIVTFGVAGAALVSGLVFGGLTLAEDGRLTGGCGATPTGCSDAELSDIRTFRVVADVSFGLSLAAAAGALTWLLLEGTGARAEAPTTALLPWVDPSGTVGMTAVGGF
jgi:tetratricopeptide (TPR) repeat protein